MTADDTHTQQCICIICSKCSHTSIIWYQDTSKSIQHWEEEVTSQHYQCSRCLSKKSFFFT